MMLGTDVSSLSTTATTAAARGLSIVVPVYNEAAGLALLHGRLGDLAGTLRQRYHLACEVIYVDDGSADSTLAIARELVADTLDIQVVSLSRNFGKEAALMAGLDHARLGAVLFMDGDGQHSPDLVEKLVGYWIDDGYDVVYTAKAHRDNESFLRRLAVHGFYALINWGARQKIPENAGDFRLLSPRAAAALRQLPERNRFFKGLASWIGFRQIRVDYEPAPRTHGSTSFSPGKLGRAFDRGPDVVLGGAVAFRQPARRGTCHHRLFVRTFHPLGNLDHRQIRPRLSFAGSRLDDDRWRAAHHDRHCRRVYRQDSLRAEGAPDLFRRRAQREARRRGKRGERTVRRRMSDAAPRRIWLCADDYGISSGVNRAIRDLIGRGRLNATSVMVVGPAIGRDEADALRAVAADSPRCGIGLHATLTAPFRPLTMHFQPVDGGTFLSLPKMLRAGLSRRLDPEIVRAELIVQFAAFKELFGRAPDFVDGHQHVQLFPSVRDGFLAAVREAAPDAWVRQVGRSDGRLGPPKALFLDFLSAPFRRRAARAGLAFNPGFAGAYDFTAKPDFGALMRQFLDRLPEHGVIMCHPGLADETLRSLDPFTTQREHEYAFLGGDELPSLLAANKVTLA